MYSLLISLLLATTIAAEPIRSPYPAPGKAARDAALPEPPGSVSLLDEYGQSSLDFEHWVDQMVDSGRLTRPSSSATSSALLIRQDQESWSVRVRNLACAPISGRRDLLERAESHFCDKFVRNAEQTLATRLEMDVTQIICEYGAVCKLGLRTVFDFFGWFQNPDDMTKICHETFDAIDRACPGGAGGVAETVVTMADGEVHTGSFARSIDIDSSGCNPGLGRTCFVGDVNV